MKKQSELDLPKQTTIWYKLLLLILGYYILIDVLGLLIYRTIVISSKGLHIVANSRKCRNRNVEATCLV